MDGDIVGVVDKANGGECLTISEAATLLGTGRNTIFAAETSALRKLRVAMSEHTVPERTSCLPPKEFEDADNWWNLSGGKGFGDHEEDATDAW